MDPSASYRNSQLRQSYHEPQFDGQNTYAPNLDGPSQAQYQSQQGHFVEEWDATQRGSSIIDGPNGHHHDATQPADTMSYNPGDDQQQLAMANRGNSLKKKSSTRRTLSLRRSGSRRSMRAGSVKSLALNPGSDPNEAHSAFYCPVPTSGNPTQVLIDRFQSWRKVLKDLIAYFREIQSHYENRGKALLKLANVSNNISTPSEFLTSAGIDDALQFLRVYNKNAILEANKAKEIEEDVILALAGLRSDLQQKIKEIKNLSGDFKNTVDKEMEGTRKAVRTLQDVLGKNEADDASTVGKQDPFLMRLAVDRQVERQLDEENYLHQAYLNLENSGRELESIVVGEIQKAYNAYAGILKREADNAYSIIDELRSGPISMSKDQEWIHFVTHDKQFIDPTIPLRSAEQIHYPGQDHVAAQEIRAGLLERKSKYLKSYTAGWYVLSTTHLHEFKSADKGQAPVMSLFLPEQKLGSHSTEGGSSNKFILKGRQTGTMHRGHTWVFRAESHDTMMAWYEDIKALTEKTPEERSQFVRHHSRSMSQSSRRSASSDGIVDEDDEEPFSADSQIDVNPGPRPDTASRRSHPGGRFPSDIQVNAQRGLQASRSPSSLSSIGHEQQPVSQDVRLIVATQALPGSHLSHAAATNDQERERGYGEMMGQAPVDVPSHAAVADQVAQYDGVNPYTSEPVTQPIQDNHGEQTTIEQVPILRSHGNGSQNPRTNTTDGSNDSSHSNAYIVTSGGDYFNRTRNDAGQATNFHQQGHQPASDDILTPSTTLTESTFHAPAENMLPRDGSSEPTRPSKNTTRNDSVNTISNLHIPGGFPRTGVA